MDEEYSKSKKRIAKEYENVDEIYLIEQKFKDNKIKLIKYNYSLDEIVQNMSAYEGYMQLSSNG